jgi:putative endonuclease
LLPRRVREFYPYRCDTLAAVRDGFNYKFWVYILTSSTGTLYIGITGYIDRRLSQHKMDSIEGFTKKYKVHRLVYYETFDYVLNAIRREKQLKPTRAGRICPNIGDARCGFGDSPSRKLPDVAWLRIYFRDPSTARPSVTRARSFTWRSAQDDKSQMVFFLHE